MNGGLSGTKANWLELLEMKGGHIPDSVYFS